MQLAVKSVSTYITRGEYWQQDVMDARRILQAQGMCFQSHNGAQKVEFVFEKPVALNGYSIEGPVERISFISREEGDEVQVTVHKKGAGSLKSYSAKWDKIIVVLPSLVASETVYRVSFEVRDFVRLRECVPSKGSHSALVLQCAEKEEVEIDFLVAVIRSQLVREKFANDAFGRGQDRVLHLTEYSASTVRSVVGVMTNGIIGLEHVNPETIALMDYLLIDGWSVVWDLVRGSLTADNCLGCMRLAQKYSDAETMLAAFKLALGNADMEAEAVAMTRESFHLFEVVKPKAFFGALAAKRE